MGQPHAAVCRFQLDVSASNRRQPSVKWGCPTLVTVDVDAITDELKERGQYLLWDASADTPRRPHWRGDFYDISWSDPDDWHTFEEAVEAANELESWGIGYVMAYANENISEGVYACIDVDGGLTEDGELQDWVPKLDLFEDAATYMERSPSGTGIHIPVHGKHIPDWWSDSQFADAGRCPDCGDVDVEGEADERSCAECGKNLAHIGVDVLENKFCTVTGDTVPESGGSIADIDPTPWLIAAYRNIHGPDKRPWAEDDDRASESDGDGYDLTEDQVKEALSHVDKELSYNDWISLGFAVLAWDDSNRGKRIFEEWSRKSPKWDDYSQKVIDWHWSNGDPTGEGEKRAGVGTLIYRAKEGDWEPPWVDTQKVEELTDLLDVAESTADDPSDETRRAILDLIAVVPSDAYKDEQERIAAALDTTEARLDQHRELKQHLNTSGPIIVEGGNTYYIRTGNRGAYRTKILNFELDVRSILKVENKELVEAVLADSNGNGPRSQFEPRDLKKQQRFEDNVLGDRFGLNFDPNGPPQDVLNELNAYIDRLDVPVRIGTHHVGLHGDEFVFPDGSLGADGWLDDPETVHVNRDVALERAVAIPTDTADYDTEDVRTVLRRLHKTRDISRFLPVLAWFYAAPLRPLIFEEWGATSFNHLNVTGNTGSGKTTTLRYLWRCFGVESDPFDVTDTRFALMTALSASNGVPVWYDEYKPGDIRDWQLDRFHEFYRKAATGGVATRGNQDQTTTEYHLEAPLVVSGEEQIRPPAERRRSIMVTFTDEVTKRGTDTRSAFKELVGAGQVENGELVLPDDAPDPSAHALAYYRWITGADTDRLRAKWQDARELVWEKWQAWDTDIDLDDMEIQGLQVVTFGWMVMREFAGDHGVSADDLPADEDLDAALRHVATEIGPDGKRKSHIDRFIELVERAAMVDYLDDGTHYVFVHEGEPGTEELRLKLSTAFDAVSKYVRDHDLGAEDLLSNPSDYRARFKEAAAAEGGYVTAWDQYTPPLNRCIGINTAAAIRELEFDRASFGLEPFVSVEEAEADDDDNDDDHDDDGDQATNGQKKVTGVRGQVEQHIKAQVRPGEPVTAASVAGTLELPPDAVEHQLNRLAQERGLLDRHREDHDYVKV